jgi:DNA-binding MarR family transcriptional regulator
MMIFMTNSAKLHASGTRSIAGRPYTIHFGPGVAPVRRTLGSLTRRVHQICMAMTADCLAGVDLTPVEYGAMGCLNKRDGEPGIDQAGLAARLGIDRNSAGVLVNGLEAKGVLERQVDGSDRRARVLRLTPAGERLFLLVREKNLAAQARVVETLAPPERDLLFDLLTKVIAAKGQFARPGAGRRKRAGKGAASIGLVPPQAPTLDGG